MEDLNDLNRKHNRSSMRREKVGLLLQHVSRLERLIKQMYRVLKGALLFIAFAARPATLKVEALAERLAIACGGLYIKSSAPWE